MGGSSKRAKENRKTGRSLRTTSKCKTSATHYSEKQVSGDQFGRCVTHDGAPVQKGSIYIYIYIRRSKEGQATKYERRHITQTHRGGVRKARAQPEFRLAGHIKSNNKSFCCRYISRKRLDEGNIESVGEHP